MKFNVTDWILLIFIGVAIIFCLCMSAWAQDEWGEMPTQESVMSDDVKPYVYDGWQDKTTLRSNTWGAKRPPEPNERLYIYKDGIKQGGYYEWDGSSWQPKNGAYTNRK